MSDRSGGCGWGKLEIPEWGDPNDPPPLTKEEVDATPPPPPGKIEDGRQGEMFDGG
ncbi:MAG TPA: hypothetical protein VN681_12335 [Stellaceae bacterium]|nr:hypothetical protein [Stellaceae bacterium]